MMESFGLGGHCACDLTQLSSLVQKGNVCKCQALFAAKPKGSVNLQGTIYQLISPSMFAPRAPKRHVYFGCLAGGFSTL